MNITRLFNTDDGESHYEDIPAEFEWTDFAPPAKPLGVSSFVNAQSVGFIQGEVGWVGDWHPVPRRQYMYTLQGEIDVTASDGETRRFGPGQGALVEDTFGKGHITKVVSDEPLIMIVVSLAD